MQKFDTPAPISTVVEIPAGRVQFIATGTSRSAASAVRPRSAPAAATSGSRRPCAAPWVLRTADGAISVDAAAGVPASLDAGTTLGRISNALQNGAGAPDLTIHATTDRGDTTAVSL